MLKNLFAALILLLALPSYALPSLPEPVSNNAVAQVTVGDEHYFVSFMGLGPGKTHKDIHNKVWSLKLGEKQWTAKKPVPSSLPLKGRLAAIAIGLKEHVFLFGGYTVAEDHSEVSSPDNFRYDVVTDSYTPIAPMPVPVDDAVALNYQDRFVFIVSGWHNDGNVNLVQRYDIVTDSWSQASPFVGNSVFGHAGALLGNVMVVCDGVKVVARANARRTFAQASACYRGIIDRQNPDRIDWRTLKHPTGIGRYRMAAASDGANSELLFFGGSVNPYNYDGIGYNGKPSSPTPHLWRFNTLTGTWQVQILDNASMDHRGLLQYGGRFYVVGGMEGNQQVTSKVYQLAP